MFNLKTIFRRMKNNRMVTLFNLTGFLLCFFSLSVIIRYVYSELDTDSFNKNKDRIFAVYNSPRLTWTPYVLINILKDNQQFGKVIPYYLEDVKSSLKYNDNTALESKTVFVDSAFFDAFSFEFIAGDAKGCITTPFSAVFTESEAHRFFGKENPIGLKLIFNSDKEITITGIIKDYPENSIFSSQCFISFSSLKTLYPYSFECGWDCANLNAFVMLNSPEKKAEAVKELKKIIQQNKDGNRYVAADLVSLHDFYFDKRIEIPEQMNKGNINVVVIFTFLGSLIFLITLFNYFNLSVAALIEKKKDNAILKIFGSSFYQQWFLLFIDTLIIAIASFILSFLFQSIIRASDYGILLSSFGKTSSGISLIIIPLVLTVVLAFFASMAGAFYIKRRPITDISDSSNGKSKGHFQMIMMMMQLCIVTLLTGSTLIINKQVDYLQNTDPGFEKENLIYLETGFNLKNPAKVIKSELLSIPGVKNVTFSDAIPGTITQHWSQDVVVNGEEQNIDFDAVPGWPDFLQTYGFRLKSGRFFYDNDESDYNNMIINESAVRKFGWENPLEQNVGKRKIVGVIADNNFHSMHTMVAPMAFINNPRNYTYITIKAEPGLENQKRIIDNARSKWNTLEPDFPFQCSYFDQHLDQEYHKEIEFRRLILFLSVISIIITGLGLIGVSFFIARKNTKEIGIRRVNGATINEIIGWLNSRFYLSLLAAIMIAVPVLWWIMDRWLQTFAYKTTLSWWIFAFSCFITSFISIVCISVQSWKAATRNPVEALRYE